MTDESSKGWLVALNVTRCAANVEIANVDKLLDAIVREFRLTVLGEEFHVFSNGGYTKVLLLGESHLSVHTWPEDGDFNLDLYTCRKECPDTKRLVEMIESAFEPKTVAMYVIPR